MLAGVKAVTYITAELCAGSACSPHASVSVAPLRMSSHMQQVHTPLPPCHTLPPPPLLLLLLPLQGNCRAVPRSHHAAFVPAQARVRFDFNTATLAVVIAIGRHLQGQQQMQREWGRGGVPPLGFQTYVSLIIYVSARCEFKFCLLIARLDQRLLCLPAGHLCLRLPLCLCSPSLSLSPAPPRSVCFCLCFGLCNSFNCIEF